MERGGKIQMETPDNTITAKIRRKYVYLLYCNSFYPIIFSVPPCFPAICSQLLYYICLKYTLIQQLGGGGKGSKQIRNFSLLILFFMASLSIYFQFVFVDLFTRKQNWLKLFWTCCLGVKKKYWQTIKIQHCYQLKVKSNV